MDELQVNQFWQKHPCGEDQVGGLEGFSHDYQLFFKEYDKYRYHKEKHILKCLDEIEFKGKRVLEIGLGQGAESEQIIRRGGLWSGLELTAESTYRVRIRLQIKNLEYESIKQGSALKIPYEDDQFDIVFSHGVLHHVPDINRAQKEICRVLRPNGELIAMVYSKRSLNYIVSICMVRRLVLLYQWLLNKRLSGKAAIHLEKAREMGLLKYLSMKNYVHKNTDGPMNPYSKVYSMKDVFMDFKNFELKKSYRRFMHAPPLRVDGLPFENQLGWHLWLHLSPRKTNQKL